MSDRAAVGPSVAESRKALPTAARHLRAALRGETGTAALLIRGVSGSGFLTLFNTLATFATAVLLARLLGTEGYGTYAYAISWITLLGVFAKAGIDQVMVRNIAVYHQAGDWAHIRGMLRFGLGLVSAAGLLCALAAAALAWLLHADAPAMRNALLVACVLLPLQSFTVPFGAAQSGLRQVVNAQLPGLLIVPLAFLLAIGVMYLLLPSPGSRRTRRWPPGWRQSLSGSARRPCCCVAVCDRPAGRHHSRNRSIRPANGGAVRCRWC